MNPTVVRARMREFLAEHLRVDKWGVNFPDQIQDPNRPPSIAREEPITGDLTTTGFSAGQGSPNPLLGTMNLEYKVMFRFDAAYSYHQIPKSQAETLTLKMISKLRISPECVDEEFREIDATGKVTVAELENKDWLLLYTFSIRPTFEVELEDLEIESFLMKAFDPTVVIMPSEVSGEFTDPLVPGSNLEALRVVAAVNEELVYADCTNIEHAYAVVGILSASVVSGDATRVLSEGLLTSATWHWQPGKPIFLGKNGQLTQTPPQSIEGSVFSLQVGTVIVPNQINFEMEQSYLL